MLVSFIPVNPSRETTYMHINIFLFESINYNGCICVHELTSKRRKFRVCFDR